MDYVGGNNTVLSSSGVGFLQVGLWKVATGTTEIDSFHPGQIAYADYTVVADYSGTTKEITKFTVVATTADAVTDVYSKVAVGDPIVDISVSASPTAVTINVTPTAGKDGCKVTFSVRYYQSSS